MELNSSQLKVYNYIKNYPNATIELIANELELSSRYVRKIVDYLRNNNYIKRVGSNKTGKWIVK